MSQIQTGTASVTLGSTNVIASAGNDWTDAQTARSVGSPVFFSVVGNTEVPYQVVSVVDPLHSPSGFWEANLISNYVGATNAAVRYILHKDFTNNLSLPIFSPGDNQTAQLLARAFVAIDSSALATNFNTLVAATFLSTKLTSDSAASTVTTLGNVAGLALPVTIALYYNFRFGIIWNAATATTGIKIGLTTPTATVYTQVGVGNYAAGAGGDTTANYFTMVEGVIVPSATGTLQVQFAAGVAAAGNVVVKQGSFGTAWVL